MNGKYVILWRWHMTYMLYWGKPIWVSKVTWRPQQSNPQFQSYKNYHFYMLILRIMISSNFFCTFWYFLCIFGAQLANSKVGHPIHHALRSSSILLQDLAKKHLQYNNNGMRNSGGYNKDSEGYHKIQVDIKRFRRI